MLAFFDISQAGVLTFLVSPDYENAKSGQATRVPLRTRTAST